MKTARELLRDSNPFYTASAGNPWEDRYPDVEAINCDAFEGVQRLLCHKAGNPTEGCAGLILGESGSGKTHLLKRILHASRRADVAAIFTYIRPILDVESPMRYLLREIVVNLCKESDDTQTRTQLDLFAAQILNDFLRNGRVYKRNEALLQRLDKDLFYIYKAKIDPKMLEAAEKRATEYLQNEIPDINSNLLRVIVKYRKQETRNLVLRWLRGDILDEEDSAHLGVASRSSLDSGALEAEARSLVLSFGYLMARYKRTMLICFDQLDNLEKSAAVRALESLVHLLVNDAHAMLPLAFIRADSWNSRFEKQMDPAVTGRFLSNRFFLRGCSFDQSKELIFRRIQTNMGEQTESSFQWLWGQLSGKVKEGYSPRQVITLANRVITEPVPNDGDEGKETPSTHKSICEADLLGRLKEVYRNECAAVLADLSSWPPDGDRMAQVLEGRLRAHPEVADLQPGKPKYHSFVFQAPGHEAKKAMHVAIVNVGGGHQRVGSCFRDGIEFLQKRPGGCCSYITDGRDDPIPAKWKVTSELRRKFETAGGKVVLLNGEPLAGWYALTSLMFKTGEGDVQVEDAKGMLRAATRKELDLLLADYSLAPIFPPFPPKKDDPKVIGPQPVVIPPTPTKKEAQTLSTAIGEQLKNSPIQMLTISLLLEKLNSSGHAVNQEGLLSYVRLHKSEFCLFENKQGMTIMPNREPRR